MAEEEKKKKEKKRAKIAHTQNIYAYCEWPEGDGYIEHLIV